jgi:mRNA interferase MazF
VTRGEIRLVNLDPAIGSEIRKTLCALSCKLTHGGKKGLILLDQMRAVDKARLAKKSGAVSAKTLTSTLSTLQEAFTE